MIGNGVPIPPDFTPTNDTDATGVFYQPDWVSPDGTLHGRMYELWGMKTPAQNTTTGKWSCKWGVRMTGTAERTNGGIPLDRLGGTPASLGQEGVYEEANWGVQATKIPFIVSTIRIEELNRREIRHPIGYKTDFISLTGPYPHVYPALNGSDSGARTDMPQGSRFRLPAGYTIPSTWDWRRKMIATAMRDYGIVFTDTAANLGIRAEAGSTAYFSDYPGGKEQLMRDLPWKDLVRIADSSATNQNPIPVAVANTVAPTISGATLEGSTLTCNPGTWTGSPPPILTYQWKRDGVNITGSTASTRVTTSADDGHALTCAVTATPDTANGGTGSAVTVTSSNSITPLAPTSFAVIDTFTDTAGVTLASHTPDRGGAWTLHPNTGGNTLVITGAGTRARPATTSGNAVYYNPTAPSTANYTVSADIIALGTILGGSMSIMARVDVTTQTWYLFRHLQGTGWQLFKFVTTGGTLVSTQLGSTVTPTSLTSGTVYSVALIVNGSSISAQVGGATIIGPITDTAITATGVAGIRHTPNSGGSATDSIGYQIDNFQVTT
jgi:hypothetical protein